MSDQSNLIISLTGDGWGIPAQESIFVTAVDEVLESHHPQDVIPILKTIESKTTQGKYAIGFLSYETSAAFSLPVKNRYNLSIPLVWFAIIEPLSLVTNTISETNDSVYVNQKFHFDQNYDEYENTIKKLKQHILDGNTYQTNYTIRAHFDMTDDAVNMYHRLYHAQPVPYAALIDTGQWSVISLSPELFLSKTGSLIRSSPMKGTHQRGRFVDEDERYKQTLSNREKDRAENIMIVDMMRNDLGKISRFGSVQVTEQFKIETFRTVLQMTSTVEAELKPGIHLHEIMQATFPAASVTGAPKYRTMQLIQEHERSPRGVYCGSIGVIKPGGDMVFNVAIRTISKIQDSCTCGIGSGIVWDSEPYNEYEEIKTKSLFLTPQHQPFQLIETMLLQENHQLLYLDEHTARMQSSAAYFSYPFHKEKAAQSLQEYTKTLSVPNVVRMLLDESGALHLSTGTTISVPNDPKIILSSIIIDSNNPFYIHKTTNREMYNRERMNALEQGAFEVIFQNQHGYITEGSISNIFILKDNVWITPPIADGLLAGTWRKHFMNEHQAVECHITIDDMRSAEKIVIGNSVMGAVEVHLACASDGS